MSGKKESQESTIDPLKERFQSHLNRFCQLHPDKRILGALIQVTAGEKGTTWEVLRRQIDYIVDDIRKKDGTVTHEEFVDSLFREPEPENGPLSAERVIDRLQGLPDL